MEDQMKVQMEDQMKVWIEDQLRFGLKTKSFLHRFRGWNKFQNSSFGFLTQNVA
jgi:hypothetical protein